MSFHENITILSLNVTPRRSCFLKWESLHQTVKFTLPLLPLPPFTLEERKLPFTGTDSAPEPWPGALRHAVTLTGMAVKTWGSGRPQAPGQAMTWPNFHTKCSWKSNHSSALSHLCTLRTEHSMWYVVGAHK